MSPFYLSELEPLKRAIQTVQNKLKDWFQVSINYYDGEEYFFGYFETLEEAEKECKKQERMNLSKQGLNWYSFLETRDIIEAKGSLGAYKIKRGTDEN